MKSYKRVYCYILLIIALLSGCQKAQPIPDADYNNPHVTFQADSACSEDIEHSIESTEIAVKLDDSSENMWQQAYYEVLNELFLPKNKSRGMPICHVSLYDLDFDGTPEMLTGFYQDGYPVFQKGYTYKDGVVSEPWGETYTVETDSIG